MNSIFRTMLFISCMLSLAAGCETGTNLKITGELLNNDATCNNGAGTPSLDLKSDSGELNAVSFLPGNITQVNYRFDKSTGLLSVKHLNAGFNCCPTKLFCDISSNENEIVITEREATKSCKCLCLFDLNIELRGVKPIKYKIKFIEPYLGTQEQLSFEIDLSRDTQGSYSVKRTVYPWGM